MWRLKLIGTKGPVQLIGSQHGLPISQLTERAIRRIDVQPMVQQYQTAL